MKYWAIDYVNPLEQTCELVVGDQLYSSEAAAEAVRAKLPGAEMFEVNWYTLPDLAEVYDAPIQINYDLSIGYTS